MADYTAHDGMVFIRGIFHTPESCERLLAIYRREAADPRDWFRHEAAALADELAEAMRQAGIINNREAA